MSRLGGVAVEVGNCKRGALDVMRRGRGLARIGPASIVDTDGRDRDPGRDLHDREQGRSRRGGSWRIEGQADHRQVGVGADDAGQRGGQAVRRPHAQPASAPGGRVLGDGLRLAVAPIDLELAGDPAGGQSSSAGCIRSRSDSEPIRMPTRGSRRHGRCRDDNGRRGRRSARRRSRPGRALRRATRPAGDGEDPSAVRDQRSVVACGAAWNTSAPVSCAACEALDRRARVALLRVAAPGDHDRDRAAPKRRPRSRRVIRAATPRAAAGGRCRGRGGSPASPDRRGQLNSMTRGPSSVIIRPAYSAPANGVPRAASSASTGTWISSTSFATASTPNPSTGE